MDNIGDFRAAIEAAGLMPPDSITPGKFIRFPGLGKSQGDDSAWAFLFNDLTGGVFGDWSSGLDRTWQAKRNTLVTPAERAAFKRRVEEARAERDAEQVRLQKAAAARAVAILEAATEDPMGHPYALKKNIPLGPLVKRGAWPQRGWDDALLVPLFGLDGRVWTLEAINAGGEKDYLKGGRKRGCFHPVGQIRGAPKILIGEGLATVAAVHAVDGAPVVAAMDRTNLIHVGRAIRKLSPTADLIFMADNDIKPGRSNPGLHDAIAAARAVGGRVAVPELDGRKCDFWDFWHERGPQAVRQALLRTESPGKSRVDGVELLHGVNITPESIRWLWEGWLARGKLEILAGPPGTGKTTIALALAATITSGGCWPDGTKAKPGNVLIWSGEDDPKDTLVPRLMAMKANMSRVFIIGDVLEAGKRRSFDPATDVPSLMTAANEVGDLHLMIVDPVVSAVHGDSHKNAEVRRGLQPLVDLATGLNCVVLGISHFSKATAGRDPVERVTGSIAFGALARVVMAAARMPENNQEGGGRLFCRAKSNIGPDGDGFRYDLQQGELDDFPSVETSYLIWGRAMDGNARDLLAQAEQIDDPEERSATDEAMEWLQQVLKKGARKAAEVQKEAKEAGISDKPLRTARERLGIRPSKTNFAGHWSWALPDQDARSCPEGAIQNSGASSQSRASSHIADVVEDAQLVEDAHKSGVASSGNFDSTGQHQGKTEDDDIIGGVI